MAETRKGISVFERYLTVWVLLCIGAGILLGKLAPGVREDPRRVLHLRRTAPR